jgi:hypothetical protein
MIKLFIGITVFFWLMRFIAGCIYLIEGDYPRTQVVSRSLDIAATFIGAILAYWGMALLSP